MPLIYKLVGAEEWQDFVRSGRFDGSPVDLKDGFIHFSYAHQLVETAAKHFRGREGLILLACDREALGHALKDEVSRGGDLFPHLFAPLTMSDIIWSRSASLGPDGVPETGDITG